MSILPCRLVRLFFFQAEDGIRDHCVTGVQTCALPISGYQTYAPDTLAKFAAVWGVRPPGTTGRVVTEMIEGCLDGATRSEERRVGKEGRCRGGRVDVRESQKVRGEERRW